MKKNYFLKEATTSSLNSKTGFFGFKDNYLSTINFWQIVAILLFILVSGSANAQTNCGTSIPITINGA